MNVDRLNALADLLARVEFATADELAAAITHVRCAPFDPATGASALLEVYADLLDVEREAKLADLDRALARLLSHPPDA